MNFSLSPDPYHSVQNNVEKLEAAGYIQLSKREAFAGKLKPGGKYYYTFNKTTLVAFSVGHKYEQGNGFKIIGGKTVSFHTLIYVTNPQNQFLHITCRTHRFSESQGKASFQEI